MIIYNPLFYYMYELALRSKSNREMPMFITIGVINLCFMFNVFSVVLILEGFGLTTDFFQKETRFFGVLIFLSFISLYYLIGKRYKRIYNNYKSRRISPPTTLKAILIVVAYYVISGALLFISALFKNKDWLFDSLI